MYLKKHGHQEGATFPYYTNSPYNQGLTGEQFETIIVLLYVYNDTENNFFLL